MLSFTGGIRIWVAVEPCDMRMGFEGLMAQAEQKLGESVQGGAMFVFGNRRRTRIKILYWDGTGLWICSKRLAEGTFSWPQSEEKRVLLRAEALAMLTDGIDLRGGKMRPWYERK